MITEWKVVRGDTLEATTSLRETDPCDDDKENTYVIPSDAEITIVFIGDASPVTIDSLTPNEVTIPDYDKGKVAFRIPPAKSSLLKVGTKQEINLQVSYNSGDDRKTFKKKSFLTVTD